MNVRPAVAALLPQLLSVDDAPITAGYLVADKRRDGLVWFVYTGDLSQIRLTSSPPNGGWMWTGEDHWHRQEVAHDQELTALLVGDEPADICKDTVWQIQAGAPAPTPTPTPTFDPYKAILA